VNLPPVPDFLALNICSFDSDESGCSPNWSRCGKPGYAIVKVRGEEKRTPACKTHFKLYTNQYRPYITKVFNIFYDFKVIEDRDTGD
jgi:hypothetical protein